MERRSGIFFAMLAASFGWNLIAKNKDTVGHIFSVAAIAAIVMYFFKRKDIFD